MNPGQKFQCPYRCREKTVLPKNWIQGLNTDFTLQGHYYGIYLGLWAVISGNTIHYICSSSLLLSLDFGTLSFISINCMLVMSKFIEVSEGFHRGLGLAKLVNFNQILGHVADHNYVRFID